VLINLHLGEGLTRQHRARAISLGPRLSHHRGRLSLGGLSISGQLAQAAEIHVLTAHQVAKGAAATARGALSSIHARSAQDREGLVGRNQVGHNR